MADFQKRVRGTVLHQKQTGHHAHQAQGNELVPRRDLVKDYIDQFTELIDLAEYSDDKTIVIKFHKGLDPAIQNMVATLRENAPDIDKPKKWFEVAQKVARNQDANEVFLEGN